MHIVHRVSKGTEWGVTYSLTNNWLSWEFLVISTKNGKQPKCPLISIIISKHSTDYYKAIKNIEVVLYVLMWNNLQDIYFAKRLECKTMHIVDNRCVKYLEMNLLGGKKSQEKGNIDRPFREGLRIWWKTFSEYHFLLLGFWNKC